MKTLIIGTGNVGKTLAQKFQENNHQVKIYNASGEIPEGFTKNHFATNLQAVVGETKLIVLAVPFEAVQSIFSGITIQPETIVIDATNPIASDMKSMSVGNTSSGAEKISEWLPNAQIVKAFNTTGWENMADSSYQNGKLTMPYAGNDKKSKQAVARIIESFGFQPFDTGDLFMARFLEPMAMVWIYQGRINSNNPNFGFSILER